MPTTFFVKFSIVAIIAFSCTPGFVLAQQEQKPPKLAEQLHQILTTQANAWNNGNIEKFMDYYWKSEKLSFSSGGKTIRGWKQTLARYKKRYPTREKMGKLTFSKLEVSPLGKTAALVLGRWKVTRKGEVLEGNFSLVFRKIEGRWLIVHDHTSLAKKPKQEEE